MTTLRKKGAVIARARMSDAPASRQSAPVAAHDLPAHLLRLAARRLQDGALPPRCYYWFDPSASPRRQGCSV